MASDKPGKAKVVDLATGAEVKSKSSEPSIYDMPYSEGDVIDCRDVENKTYILRSGVVFVKKAFKLGTETKLVEVETLKEEGKPLFPNLLFGLKHDPELILVAGTSVTIGEYPNESMDELRDTIAWNRGVTKAVLERMQRLSHEHVEVIEKSLIRDSRRENPSEAFAAMEQELREARHELDILQAFPSIPPPDPEESGVELAFAEAETKRLEDELKGAKAEIEKLKAALKESKKHEKVDMNARAMARDAFDYMQELDKRAQEESVQFPALVNTVLQAFGERGITTPELKQLLTDEEGTLNGLASSVQFLALVNTVLRELGARGLSTPELMQLLTGKEGTDNGLAFLDEEPDSGHTVTLIPMWDPSVEMLPSDPPPAPIACPTPGFAPTSVLANLDVPVTEVPSRPAITTTLQRIPAGLPPRPESPPTVRRPDFRRPLPREEPVSDPPPNPNSAITATRREIPAGRPPRPDPRPEGTKTAVMLAAIVPQPAPRHGPPPLPQQTPPLRHGPPPLPVTMPTPRNNYTPRSEHGVRSFPTTEPFAEEEAPTSRGMPVDCPPAIPMAEPEDGKRPETAAIDVRAFRPKK